MWISSDRYVGSTRGYEGGSKAGRESYGAVADVFSTFIKKLGEGEMSLISELRLEPVVSVVHLFSECFLRGRPPGRPFSLRTSGCCECLSQGRCCTCAATRIQTKSRGNEYRRFSEK